MIKHLRKTIDISFVFETIGESISLVLILSLAIGFSLFNEEFVQDHGLVTATFLLITGVSLLSWMRPEEDSRHV